MKNIWLIVVALVAGIVLGRLSVEPKVVTETVVEHHTINTSALTPIKVSEPIGSREVKVMLRKNLFPNIDQVGDVKEDNFPMIDHCGDSTIMVDHIEEVREMVDSAEVELPLRDYTFTDDSTYTITARGVYVESLPQIEFTPRIVTTTRTETVVRAPRIIHGLQLGAGAALTPKGLQPAIYVGYGFSIKF